MEPRSDITPLLEKAHAGDARALNEVARRVQSDLERLARKLLGKGLGLRSITLDPAALVNETFVRLLKQRKRWVNHAHFFHCSVVQGSCHACDNQCGRTCPPTGTTAPSGRQLSICVATRLLLASSHR